MSQPWYSSLPQITKKALDKQEIASKKATLKKQITDRKLDAKKEKDDAKREKHAKKFVEIVVDKLNSSYSLLSLYVESQAKAGNTSVYVRPCIVMSCYSYYKYWQVAAKNIDAVNQLFANNPISKNLYVILSSDGKYLIVGWGKS